MDPRMKYNCIGVLLCMLLIVPGQAMHATTEGSPISFEGVSAILFVLDASKSMGTKYQLDASGPIITRLDLAKSLITRALQLVPSGVDCGLRVYGGSNVSDHKQACTDTKLCVPLQPKQHRVILRQLKDIKPLGESALSYTLKQALTQDLKDRNSANTIIVLLTDENESCDEPAYDAYRYHLASAQSTPRILVLPTRKKTSARRITGLSLIAFLSGGSYYGEESFERFFSELGNIWGTASKKQGELSEQNQCIAMLWSAYVARTPGIEALMKTLRTEDQQTLSEMSPADQLAFLLRQANIGLSIGQRRPTDPPPGVPASEVSGNARIADTSNLVRMHLLSKQAAKLKAAWFRYMAAISAPGGERAKLRASLIQLVGEEALSQAERCCNESVR
jgi:hypothetical protein